MRGLCWQGPKRSSQEESFQWGAGSGIVSYIPGPFSLSFQLVWSSAKGVLAMLGLKRGTRDLWAAGAA